MKSLAAFLFGVALLIPAVSTLAEDPNAVLDKAIEAVGGEKKLSEAAGYMWKVKGKFILNGTENEFSGETIVQDLDHVRNEFEGTFGGNMIEVQTVFSGDKGWRSFSGTVMPLEGDTLATEKRNASLQLTPAIPTLLKGDRFKLTEAGEEQVGGKPAVGIKVTSADDKNFTIYFDKESGLPAMLKANVTDFSGQEFVQETIFSEYKDFDGLQKATRIEQKRDGETFVTTEVIEFKPLDEIPADSFAEQK